jgi:baseplate upper protein BppU
MNDAFEIKQGNLLPELGGDAANPVVIRDGLGNPVNLSGGTVKFTMTLKTATTPKISLATATIVSASLGTVKYTWAGNDTDTPGHYKAEFEVIIGGKKFSAPNYTYLNVHILPKLA